MTALSFGLVLVLPVSSAHYRLSLFYKGLSLYLGIEGTGIVKGVPLSRQDKDDIGQMLDLTTNQLIHPRYRVSIILYPEGING